MNRRITLVTLISAALLAACSGPSSEELAQYKAQCVKFHERERSSPRSTVQALDHWTKNGKVVIELAEFENSYSSAYTSYLCVIDPGAGSLSLPGVFNQEKWRK
ncbi:hypothetical protein SDC9_59210 [bioreactor metagenome]|uniref:Lipoprotein n=1 Tax=bioreactor metagenome TaxID=1076179 RepID=A0A644X9J0_9ZZZZ